MKYVKILKSNNTVDSVINSGSSSYVLSDEDKQFYELVEVDNSFDLKDCIYVDGSFVEIGSPPTDFHEYNLELGLWEDTRSVEELIAECQQELRRIRQRLLSQSDWTQFPDSPLTEAQKVEWQVYRQSLRDMPQTYANETNIENVVFPEKP